MTKRWFDGTILVVSLFLVAVGGLAKPWARRHLMQGTDGPVGVTAATVELVA